MNIGKNILRFLDRFKYIIVGVLGVVMLTVVGENSLLQRYRYSQQIGELEEEIDKQQTRFVRDSLRLSELERNPDAIRKIALERYFMKAYDEDIFVLSDDLEEEEEAHATTQ
jgi:cell division protein FtsB